MASPATNSHMVGAHTLFGFRPTDKQKSDDVSTQITSFDGIDVEYKDMSSLDARLNAINATVYSQDRLNSMTLNDKLYALRLNDDSDTI